VTEYQPSELAGAFVAAVGSHFAALEKTYALHRSLTVEVLGPRGLVVVEPDQIGDRFFLISLVLASQTLAVTLTYGDAEDDLQCLIARPDLERTYALWEWLDALDERQALSDEGGWVLSADRVERVVALYDSLLEHVLPAALSASADLLRRLDENAEHRYAEEQRSLAEAEHRSLAARAAEAFRRRDYVAVVQALSAVPVELTPAEQAKLKYARRKLG